MLRKLLALSALLLLITNVHADTLLLIGVGGGASGGATTETPIFLGHQGTTNEPSTSAVNYAGPGNNWSATESAREWPMPITGNASALTASFQTALTGGQTYIVSLLDVTASTSIGGANCTLTAGNSGYCNDTTDNPMNMTAGDLFVVKSDPNSTTPTAQATASSISFLMTSVAGESAIFAGSVTVSASAQNYQGFGGRGTVSATEINVSVIVPGPTAGASVGKIDHLFAHGGGTPASSKGYAVLLYKNGAVTTQGGGSTCETAVAGGTQATILSACTCVIYSAQANCNNTTSSDATVTVNAGDTISIETYPYGTPAAIIVNAAMRYVPSTSTDTIAFGNFTTLPTGITAKYGQVYGFMANATVEAQTYNAAPAAMHIKDMWTAIDTVAPSGDTRTQLLRGGASGSVGSTSLTCGIGNAASGITVGGVSNTPACIDANAGHSFSSGAVTSTPQYFDITTSQNAGSTSIAAWYKTSVVMTVP